LVTLLAFTDVVPEDVYAKGNALILTLDPADPSFEIFRLMGRLPRVQRVAANAFAAELRSLKDKYQGIRSARDFALPLDVAGTPESLIVTLADLPAGYVNSNQTSDLGARGCGDAPASSCAVRAFDHPRLLLLVSVRALGQREIAKTLMKKSKTASSSAQDGRREVSLGETLGEESFGFTSTTTLDRGSSALVYEIWARQGSIVNVVWLLEVGGTSDVSAAINVMRAQIRREPLR